MISAVVFFLAAYSSSPTPVDQAAASGSLAAAHLFPSGSGRFQARLSSFANDISLKFRQRRHEVKHQHAREPQGIDAGSSANLRLKRGDRSDYSFKEDHNHHHLHQAPIYLGNGRDPMW